jgi:hypothetical protein
MTSEDLNYVCRDISGQFAPLMTTEELKRYSEMTKAMRQMDRDKRKEAYMSRYVSELLYLLVDHFEKPYIQEIERYSQLNLRRFPRKRYHDVLMVHHPVSRNRLIPSQSTPGLTQPSNVACASFCNLVNRLEQKGWVRRVKDGRKLYLKITQAGLEKIKAYHDYFSLGII